MSGSSTRSRIPRWPRVALGGFIAFATLFPAACSKGPERDTATFCSDYVEVARQGAKLANPDDVSLSTLRSQVRRIDEAASKAADHAPEDIAADVDALIAPLHDLRSQLDDADNRTQATRALRTYRAKTAKLSSTQKRLDFWTNVKCGVVPVTSTTTPVTIQPDITG